MKLSMSMISWYLKDFHPVVSIQDDGMTIDGVRFLFDENMERENRYVYFLRADIILSDIRHADSFIVVNNRSTLLFHYADMNELMNRLLAAFDFFNSWESRLMEAAFSHYPLQKILDIGEEVLDNPCAAGDFTCNYLVHSNKEGQATDPYWEYSKKNRSMHPAIYTAPYRDLENHLITELSDQPTLVENVYEGGAPVLMAYMRENEQMLGCLAILQSNPGLTEMNIQLSPFLIRFLCKAGEFANPDGSLRPAEGILSDILSGIKISQESLNRLHEFLPAFPLYCFVSRNVFRTDEISRKLFLHVLKQNPLYYIPMIKDKRIVFFAGEHVYRNPDVYMSGQDYRNNIVGISLPVYDVSELYAGYLQALSAMEESGEKPGIYDCRKTAFSYLLKELSGSEMTGQLLHPAIGILKRHDEKTGSELLKTLTLYLECHQNLTNASRLLSIHTNTLKYRIQKIMELCEINFEDSAQIRYLQLSIWLAEEGLR